MTPLNLDAHWSLRNRILVLSETKMRDVLLAGLDLLEFEPAILTRIETDLENMSLEKKRLRLADRQWAHEYNVPLLDFDSDELEQTCGPTSLNLGDGRPRLVDAHCTYVFLCLRGYLGSVSSQEARERLLDSQVIHTYLTARGLPLPADSTLRENLNAVSNETRDFILDAQLRQTLRLELDDFTQVSVDSTGTEANSAWPTDSKILLGLLGRIYRGGQQLSRFDLTDFRKHHSERWLRELQKLDFRICLTLGKAKSKRKIKKHYRKFLKTCGSLLEHLTAEYERLDELCRTLPLLPSQRRLLDRLWEQIHDDLRDVATVCSYTKKRVFNDVVLPAPEKILSLSDRSAAFIKKGQRESLIGYKPQLCRSANGFVTALMVDEGNPSDSSKLVPVVKQHIQRTEVVPAAVSTDDGYASAANRDKLFELDIKAVSINGAKGKRLTPDEQWNSGLYGHLRNQRSAVESLMFTLKYCFHFDRMARRGLEQVNAEMLEKVIAHNLWRMSHVDKQRALAAS